MHTLQSGRDFSAAQSEASPTLPCKNVTSESSEKAKSDEKPRPPSANSSSAVKPPYSYIALSNYPRTKRSSDRINFPPLPHSNNGNSAVTAQEIDTQWNL